MRRILTFVSATLLGLAMMVGPAAAEGHPPPHTHHVNTGNGGCVDIDRLFATGHGLHVGSNKSSGFDISTFNPTDPSTYPKDRGPWHGTCEAPW
jgi:hypothetical protein